MRRSDDAPDAVVIPRDDFLTRYWDYKPGQHVTILAPSQWGKTTLGHQLLVHTTVPHPPIVLVMKPRDPATTRWLRQHEGAIRRTPTWPPPVINHVREKPDIWALWPKHQMRDTHQDNLHLFGEFRRAYYHAYRHGHIIVSDELYSLENELWLKPEVNMIYTKGSSMGAGQWAMSQRGAYISQWAYGGAAHLFLAADPDRRARQRYSEIGGVDPEIILHNLARLKKFQWLYIAREGPHLCIVDK